MPELPEMTPPARAAFARLTHATAHEVMALRTLGERIRQQGVATVADVQQLVGDMVAERVRALGLQPDEVFDAYESATLAQRMDLELVRGSFGHA